MVVQIKACLFDMDGLLIDSERIYTETTELLLARHGKPPVFPISIKSRMMGRPHPESAQIFIDWSGTDMSPDQYQQEQKDLQVSRFPFVKVMPGARALLTKLHQMEMPMGLATSSTTSNYALKSTHLKDFFGVFGEVVMCGDDERIIGKGKPRPDIFLHSLDHLNRLRREKREPEIMREECLVFEDGVPGVEAGLAAGMQVLWVPDEKILEIHRDQVDQILGDRGRMVKSLEDFDWAYYGLDGPKSARSA